MHAAFFTSALTAVPALVAAFPELLVNERRPAFPLRDVLAACHVRIGEEAPALAQARHFPATADDLWAFFGQPSRATALYGLQKVYTAALELPLVARMAANRGRVARFDQERTARLRCLAQPGASLWLMAIPTTAALKMADGEFRFAARHRLALPPMDDLPPRCPCGTLATADHAHQCKNNGRARTLRHNLINRTLERLAAAARYTVTHEPRYYVPGACDGDEMDRQSPDCVLIGPHRTIAVDVSVVCPTGASYMRRAAATTLAAAAQREQLKLKKYSGLAQQEGLRLVPFVLESYGAFGRMALDLLGTMEAHAAEHHQRFDVKDARQALSVALQRGNALVALQCCVTARLGRAPSRMSRG
jgi:hypothetical protein